MNTSSTSKKALSPFGQYAVQLDSDFSELERLSGEIERLDIDTDSGFEHGKKLLTHFTECSQRIGGGIQNLAQSLEGSRTRAEKAAQLVAARAALIQERQLRAEGLLERFQALGEMVKKITTAVSQMQKPAGAELSDEEKSALLKHLPDLNNSLGILIAEANRLKEDSDAANLKSMSRNADSLGQSLASVRQKLNIFVEHSAGNSSKSTELH